MTSPAKSAYRAPREEIARENDWLNWLKAAVDPRWRREQWDHERWLMTIVPGDPTTTVRKCAVAACNTAICNGKLCAACSKARRAAEAPLDEFTSAYQPKLKKDHPGFIGGRKQCSAKVTMNVARARCIIGRCATTTTVRGESRAVGTRRSLSKLGFRKRNSSFLFRPLTSPAGWLAVTEPQSLQYR